MLVGLSNKEFDLIEVITLVLFEVVLKVNAVQTIDYSKCLITVQVCPFIDEVLYSSVQLLVELS